MTARRRRPDERRFRYPTRLESHRVRQAPRGKIGRPDPGLELSAGDRRDRADGEAQAEERSVGLR